MVVRSLPSSSTRPRVACARPPITCSIVDFPHPDGPMIETNSPGMISMLTPRSAGTSTLPCRYTFHRFSVLSMGSNNQLQNPRTELLVGQRLDRILPARQPGRVRRAQQSAYDRDQPGAQNPRRGNQNRQRREQFDENRTHQKTQPDATYYSRQAQQRGLAQNDLHDVRLRSPQRLQHPNFPRALDDR